MGSLSRTKGKTGEREVVNMAREAGLEAARTWETAQSRDPSTRACDVKIAGCPHQVKWLARGFTLLYDALTDVSGVFIRQNGQRWLVVIDAQDYLAYLKFAREHDLEGGSLQHPQHPSAPIAA